MKERRKGKFMFIFLCIFVFVCSLGIGIISKIVIQPDWAKRYSVEFTDEIGKVYKDISYGEEKSNKFDLYLPADN